MCKVGRQQVCHQYIRNRNHLIKAAVEVLLVPDYLHRRTHPVNGIRNRNSNNMPVVG